MLDSNDLADPLLTELEQLRALKLRCETVLDNLVQGVCMFDAAHRLVLFNRRYLELYDIPSGAIQPGATSTEVAKVRGAAGSLPNMDADSYVRWRTAAVTADQPHNSIAELQNGRTVLIHHCPAQDGGWVATIEDITDSRRAEARIAHLAAHDPLTGLDNRHIFQARLEQAAASRTPDSPLVALLYLDLDRFMTVNDTLGHAAGDRLLQQVAERLRVLCRRSNTVARLGADEFAVIDDDIGEPHQAEALAARMIETIARPFAIEGQELRITASVGVALSRPGDPPEPERLMRAADTALRRAKADGRGKYCAFRPDMIGAAGAREQLQRELRHALAAGEFRLHYQPQVDLASERWIGAEALIRWCHPTRGLVGPNEFIPFAEENGLAPQIDEWVLRTACRDAAPWRPLRLAINMSPAGLRIPGLVDLVADALRESGLEPERLELEITERVLIGDHEASTTTLCALAALGVRLAVDDFGTGYASFDYLRRYPFNKLKIDGSFIRDLATDANCFAITQAIVVMGRRIGLSVNAEGVETAMQAGLLRSEGCMEAQGFLFGRAMPPAEFARLLSAAPSAQASSAIVAAGST